MKDTMGIILTGSSNSKLKELSAARSSSAIPVGGKYRAIDFVLSNMVNSGITNVGVLTQYNYRSLMDHLGSGKEWDLDRKREGLFIFPPYLSSDDTGWYKGSADAMYNNLTFIKRSDEEYVLIAQGNCVYNMLYDDMLDYHIQKGADITLAYREMDDYSQEDISRLGVLDVDQNEKILDIQEKPLHPKSKSSSIGVYILKRELLIALLEECAAHGNYDFVKDVLIKKLEVLNVMGYKYNGYWRSLNSIQMYYRCNMELLDPEIRYKLFVQNGRIYTKVKDEAPAKYNEEAEVRNSIVADGCIIEGKIENSVIFRGVTLKRGAVIKNSIIMQGSVVEENSTLENAILDKGVVITNSKYLKGESNWPIIISKNVVV